MAETESITITPYTVKSKGYETIATNTGTQSKGPYYGDIAITSGQQAQYSSTQSVRNRSEPTIGFVWIESTYSWKGSTFTISAPAGAYLSMTINIRATGKGRLVILPKAANELGVSYNYDNLDAAETLYTFSSGNSAYATNKSDIIAKVCQYGIGVVPTYTGGDDKITSISGSVRYIATGIPPQVSNVEPISQTVLASSDTVFKWSYRHVTNMPQASWELHFVRNGTDTVLASAQDSSTSCTIPADTLPTGAAQWYVVVTAVEEDYTLTAQSDPSYIIVRTNPSTSDVTVDNNPRLTVEWIAADQQAAQIRVGDTVYPTAWTDEGSYTIPEILSDGVYPVSVRTQTTEGDWSGWSEEIYADIKNVPPTGAEPPELTYTVAGTTASLIWTEVTGAEAYVLYRSGVPIYAGDGTAFVDARVSGLAEYKVRALLAGGVYIESAPQTLIIIPGADTLVYSDGGVPRELPIRHHPQYPTRRWDESADVEFNNYAGRTLPVAVYDGHVSRGLTLTAAYRSPQEASALLSLLGKTVIYKSKKGDGCRGVIVSASRDSSLTDAVTYRITATDDDERAWLT